MELRHRDCDWLQTVSACRSGQDSAIELGASNEPPPTAGFSAASKFAPTRAGAFIQRNSIATTSCGVSRRQFFISSAVRPSPRRPLLDAGRLRNAQSEIDRERNSREASGEKLARGRCEYGPGVPRPARPRPRENDVRNSPCFATRVRRWLFSEHRWLDSRRVYLVLPRIGHFGICLSQVGGGY